MTKLPDHLEIVADDLCITCLTFDIDVDTIQGANQLMKHLVEFNPQKAIFCESLPSHEWLGILELAGEKYNRTCRLAAQL
jgi:hypothetical protein